MADDPKKKALETASIVEDALRSIAGQVRDIFDQAMSGADQVTQSVTKDIQSRFNQMAKVTDDIASNSNKLQQGLLKTKDVEDQILKRKAKQDALSTQLLTHLRQQGKEAANIEELISKQNQGLIQLTDHEKDLISEFTKASEYNELYINQLQEQLASVEEINKATGVTGKLLKGITKIPIVGQFLDAENALNASNEAAAKGAGKVGAMGAAFKSLGGNLMETFKDPLFSVGLLVKGFKMFLDLGFKADTEVTNLSKSMASSKEEATATRDRFIEIQNTGKSLFETTTNLVAAQLELADAFGATKGFSESQLKDQVLLTKQMGFQAEEASGIQQLAMSNGMTAREVTGSVIKQTAALAKQKGIQLDNKQIIGDVAKVSGQLRLQYANNPKLIAKAVVQTKQLGLTLEQAAQAANSLLDFESSIENELSAELLTGKALNLERARGLALNGDAAGAAAEMAKQVGTAADFTKMNVIQQEALAKSVGMSADELANSLITQENLAKLGSETKKQLEEKAAALRAEGKIDEANKLLASAGDEKQAQAALERISAQDKFNAAIEKLKSMLSSIVEGPAGKFVDYLGKLLSDANKLKGILTAIKAIAIGLAVAFAVMNPIAATAGLAIAGGIYAATSMNDGVINPKGGMVVSGPEGSIQLNKKDSIIAGTNLGGGNNNGGNSSNELRELKNMVAAIANRPINVSIDGKKVIEATTGNQPNTVGDESRKNSYQIS
jgi:hypothetical protein